MTTCGKSLPREECSSSLAQPHCSPRALRALLTKIFNLGTPAWPAEVTSYSTSASTPWCVNRSLILTNMHAPAMSKALQGHAVPPQEGSQELRCAPLPDHLQSPGSLGWCQLQLALPWQNSSPHTTVQAEHCHAPSWVPQIDIPRQQGKPHPSPQHQTGAWKHQSGFLKPS